MCCVYSLDQVNFTFESLTLSNGSNRQGEEKSTGVYHDFTNALSVTTENLGREIKDEFTQTIYSVAALPSHDLKFL